MYQLVGGGRNTVPKPGTDLPEITDGRTLYANMKFYNLLGHGAMYPGQHNVFLVPDNTWILFVTRASVPADKRKSGTLRRVLDDFYFLREGETPAQWHERIYAGMNDGSLFREILYQTDAQEQFSIYEPGDLIQDLTLQFHNESWPFMRLGVWTCPIAADVKSYLDIINNGVEIAKYNDELKTILDVELPSIAREKPTIAAAIPKMIDYINNFSTITMESNDAFFNDADVVKALKDKAVEKVFYNALGILQSSAKYGQGLNRQYEFFNKPTNILRESPSAMNVERNNGGKIKKFLESTLYTLLNETKFRYRKENTGASPPIGDDLLLQTPKYRFIVVDACRSIETIGKPEALYAGRAALTRRLSVSVRNQVCMNSLIQMNRRRFSELVAGRTIDPASAIAKLLAGQNVPLPEFEASVIGAASGQLRNVLVRPFKRNDKVFYLDGLTEKTGRVQNANLNASGQLFYTINLPSGEQKRVAAGKVFKSGTNFIGSMAQKLLEMQEQEAAQLEESEKQAEAVQKLIQKRVAEKRLEKQKTEWDIKYADLVKKHYGDFAKRYQPRLDVITRVAKGTIPAGEFVRIDSYRVSPDGQPGYVASLGTTQKKFYGLLNINSSDERARIRDLKDRIPVGKRFEKGQLVVLSDIAGTAGALLNGKIGKIVNIDIARPVAGGEEAVIYRVQVVVPDDSGTPMFKVYGLKPEKLTAAEAGSTMGDLPRHTLVEDYTKLVLTPEQEAAILAEVTAEVTRNNDLFGNLGRGGGRYRKRTRRSVKRRRQTKRRASKH